MVSLLGKRLEVMRSVMDRSEKLEIQNASDYASMSNAYKYYQGQLLGLNKFDLVGQKTIYENSLSTWINLDADRKEKYGTMFSRFAAVYSGDDKLDFDMGAVNLAGLAPSFVKSIGIAVYRLQRSLESGDETQLTAMKDIVADKGAEYIESNMKEMDLEIFKFALGTLKNEVSSERRPDFFQHTIYKDKAKGSNEKFAALVMNKSILGNAKKLKKFLKDPTQEKIDKDPGMLYVNSVISTLRTGIQPGQMMRDAELSELKGLYTQAIQEKETSKIFYPNANSTMRVTYGSVKSYDSWEGKRYETFTTGDQILGKYKAGDDEFDVPEKLRTLLTTNDFGDYAREDGKLPVCFLHNTDITGGNSGSPVISAEGHLIGVAFDGNWESMTSDLFWQDQYVRTISVDIRYVLFIIDKFAGASHLLDEMNLVK